MEDLWHGHRYIYHEITFTKNTESVREKYSHSTLKKTDGGGIIKWIEEHSYGNTIPLPLGLN